MAAPGRASRLLAEARRLLGSTWTGAKDGKLAALQPGIAPPARGPLSDGAFDRAEMVALLHRSAVPFEPEGPARYLLEGFGALRPESVALAMNVLAGRADLPPRPEEEAAHAAVTAARRALFPPGRCEYGV